MILTAFAQGKGAGDVALRKETKTCTRTFQHQQVLSTHRSGYPMGWLAGNLPMIRLRSHHRAFLPPSLNCPRWNECRAVLGAHHDGILNGDPPARLTDGITPNDPKLLQSPDLTVRHVD